MLFIFFAETGFAITQSSEFSHASASHGRAKVVSLFNSQVMVTCMFVPKEFLLISCVQVEESSQEQLNEAAGTSSDSSEVEEIEAILQSKDMTCGICMDKVYERTDARERVFGILPNCNHSFCLQCILTWRKTKGFGSDVVR